MSDNPNRTCLQALTAVMEDVQAVGKGDTNTQQGYKFRGIDAVVNAVGPALRRHGVIVVPVSVSADVEHYQTSKGTPMRNVTLTVGFRFYGPAGDHIEATVCGESADSGDKAVPKAHSVAYRTLLLQALCIPTDEPDPDLQSNERGSFGQPVTPDSNGAAKRPELLKRLEDIVYALNASGAKAHGHDSWKLYYAEKSKDLHGKLPSESTVAQIRALIQDAEKELANATPDVPF